MRIVSVKKDFQEIMTKIFKGDILFTPTPACFETLEDGYIVTDDHGKITGIYASDASASQHPVLPEQYRHCQIADYSSKLLIPAMYDLHVHAPQYRNQGIAMDLELLPWLQTYTFPEESNYADQHYAQVSYRHFVEDMLRQGTVRAAVFATIHPEATKILAHLFHEAGMGAKIGLVGMNRNCPETLSNTVDEVVQHTIDLMNETADMPLVDAIITPRFIPSCTPEMLTALGKLAQEKSLCVQSHLSENRSEIAWVKELEPQATCYGDAYHRYGLFGQTPTLMAHCCYTNEEELALMKQNQVFVVHCPTSNCNVASGIAPIRRFLEESIPVALGSDISGGHHLSMFHVMQNALQVSKLLYAQTNGALQFLTLSEVFHTATKSGGSFFGKAGSFEQGYDFDALVIDDSDLTRINLELHRDPYTLQQRLERFIYLGDDRHIVARFCQGREL